MKLLGPSLATCQLATWVESAAKLECWLLRLNPGAVGEHLTSQFSWVAAWLLITRVCPVHPAEESLLLVFYVPLWLSWCVMMVLLTFFCMVSMVLVMWEVAASKFIHNKSLLTSILFYYYFFFEIPCILWLFRMTSMQCTICGFNEGEMNLVGEKGLKALLMATSKKKETELTQTLKDLQNRRTPVHVHHDCRRRLTNFRKKPVGLEPKRLCSSCCPHQENLFLSIF